MNAATPTPAQRLAACFRAHAQAIHELAKEAPEDDLHELAERNAREYETAAAELESVN